jgi:3-deoxy-D-manno-octulosonic-acid transferase
MVLFLYRLLFPVALLLALPFYLLRLRRRERGRAQQAKPPGYHLGLGQRFGFYTAEMQAALADGPRPWWLVSISVGETLLALKLVKALRASDPAARVVLSVTTSTGYELLLRETAGSPWLLPVYNPIDLAGATRRALRAIRPRALVLIEGGIWPNLLSAARRASVPVALASARLSPRSERRWKKIPWLTRPVWSLFDRVAVAEPGDVERFAAIGVPRDRLVHTGNIKFDNAAADPATTREAEFREIVAALGWSGPIFLAGSTWAPEEKALAAAYRVLRTEWPALRLIVVPRHVERAGEVEREFAGLRVVRRSQLPAFSPSEPTESADVLLVDSTGELRDWYRLATVVFVGKSLPGVAQIGGQNLGEPAALGLPVIFGPHMENFTALVTHLLERDAAVRIADAAALPGALSRLLADPARCCSLGERAAAVVLPHQGASARTAAVLAELQS